MGREQRLQQLKQILQEREEPVSGAALARYLDVSRQAIVQDVALLKSRGEPVRTTPRGYRYDRSGGTPKRLIAVRHGTDEISDELMAIVGMGAKVVDVLVEHQIYGELRGNIDVADREDVLRFLSLLEAGGNNPLLTLSDGVHLHTLEADSEETLDGVERRLEAMGILLHGQGRGDRE